MRKGIFAVVLLIAVIVVLIGKNQQRQRRVGLEIFGGQEWLNSFAASTLVAQRLHKSSETDQSDDLFHQYTKGEIVELSAETNRKLKKLLTSAKSYTWSDDAKACGVDFGVLLTAVSSQRTQYVALCFKCDQLAVFNDQKSRPVNIEYDMDPMRKPLIEVIKPIFPKDEEIRKLR